MIKYLDLKRINDLYDAEIREAINEVLDSGWYLKGEATRKFEQAYAQYIGTKHCIGCANGLDALTLILRAYIEMGEGQRQLYQLRPHVPGLHPVLRQEPGLRVSVHP